MKALTLVAVLLFTAVQMRAQYVTIPDTAFVNWLQSLYSGALADCMVGDQLDTTCPALVSENALSVSNFGISDLTGVQYFDNLSGLSCAFNNLTFLPPLPGTLTHLSCEYNQLASLPALPNGLTNLSCYSNNLTALPPLPGALKQLWCT